jgi:hypothetical protein
MESSDTSTVQNLVIVAISVGLITLLAYYKISQSSNTGNSSTGSNKEKIQELQTSTKVNESNRSDSNNNNSNVSSSQWDTVSKPANDVWEERRRRGIPAASLHVKKDVSNKKQKPFGSSYYYAHNSTKTGGGYKDGLTMEDFTMNGPRLLSRNGQPVVTDDHHSEERNRPDEQNDLNESKVIDITDSNKQQLSNRRIIYITKYLWDDPGSKDGIATIRIDTVPSYQNNSDTISWIDIRPFITNIIASVTGNETNNSNKKDGLNVKIETSVNCNTNTTNENDGVMNIDYVIRIPKLYGYISKVDTISKEKRLLIKLYKYSTILDKSNLKVWPHPQKKIG